MWREMNLIAPPPPPLHPALEKESNEKKEKENLTERIARQSRYSNLISDIKSEKRFSRSLKSRAERMAEKTYNDLDMFLFMWYQF